MHQGCFGSADRLLGLLFEFLEVNGTLPDLLHLLIVGPLELLVPTEVVETGEDLHTFCDVKELIIHLINIISRVLSPFTLLDQLPHTIATAKPLRLLHQVHFLGHIDNGVARIFHPLISRWLVATDVHATFLHLVMERYMGVPGLHFLSIHIIK